MVMPRAFSSGRRSVSTPVSARTSAVLPWSMWPAVPTIMRRFRTGAAAASWPRKACCVLQAAQVEPQGAVGDAADHRDGQPARNAASRRAERPAASADRAHHQGVARQPIDRQRAAADLALARLDSTRHRPAGQGPRSGPASRSLGQGLDLGGRAGSAGAGSAGARRAGPGPR